MTGLLVLIFLGVIVVQVPIAFLISFDARRLGLENPEMYELGVLVPAGGLSSCFCTPRNDATSRESTTNPNHAET